MIMLWIAAALMAALSAGLVMHRAARAARLAGAPDPAMAVYRRQLAEIDDLADRGLMADDERRAARAETGRRLLAQADAGEAPVAGRIQPATVMLIAGAPALAAVALYALVIGQPGLPDLPFGARLAQWKAHPEQAPPEALGALLGELARARPTDPEPLLQLARLDLELGDTAGGAHALRRAALVAPTRADIWTMLAQVQIVQAQGQVDAQAEASLQKVLSLDPGNAVARYDLARARILRGDIAGGLADWKTLDATLPAGDPRKGALEADITSVEKTGRPTPPEAPPPAEAGPAPAQQGAGTAAMIQGMVEGLAARLKANPDDPAGWVRLVRAYTVLGETGKRDAALAQARHRYAGRPDILGQLDAAMAPPK
jgi:cytochrome c-type biogenesis protein CcmH